jgi:hypothetical protein
MATLSEKL